MSRHSKNNNASSVFTYAERQKLNYGTQAMRVGRDSLRDFDSCFLCLASVIDPVCCTRGHMACRECMLKYILAQKKAITKEVEKQAAIMTIEQQREKEEEERKEKEAEMFVKTQQTLVPSKLTGTGAPAVASSLEGIKGKHAENSFWVPAKTPGVDDGSAAVAVSAGEVKRDVLCPMVSGDEKEHSLHLKKLIAIKFSHERKSSKKFEGKGKDDDAESDEDCEKHKICPSCRKTLSNSLQLSVARPCGHVLCKNCSDKFSKPAKRCFVCEKSLKNGSKDLVDLYNEGTGFSSKSKVEVKRSGTAFKV